MKTDIHICWTIDCEATHQAADDVDLGVRSIRGPANPHYLRLPERAGGTLRPPSGLWTAVDQRKTTSIARNAGRAAPVRYCSSSRSSENAYIFARSR